MTAPLEDRIAQAIGDPHSLVARSWSQVDGPESITRWSTRAVMVVVNAELEQLRAQVATLTIERDDARATNDYLTRAAADAEVLDQLRADSAGGVR